jgi:diacylglycerol kinase (ATP)
MNEPFGFFLFNASAGTAGKFTSAALMAELPSGTRLHEFVEGDDPVKLARDAVSGGAQWIAVAGGDGTVEAVAGALVGSPTPLGVIACGTYNNFARSADIPKDPLEAARLVRNGVTRQMDVGFVNEEPFFECVGAGLDAAIFPLGEEIKSGGFLNWFQLFKTAAKYPRQVFDISLDRPFREALIRDKAPPKPSKSWRDWLKKTPSEKVRLRALMVTVSNGPFYGANFAVAPNARIDDGMLTVTIFKKYNKLELWWHFWSIRAGKRVYAPRVVTLSASALEISGPKRLEVHKDGSAFDQWPLKLRLESKRLTVFCKPGATPSAAAP